MSKIFLTIVNMSISASYLALAVMLLRLLLRKAPKWITVLLWGIVAVRLVCPVFIESEVSLIPRNEWIKPPEVQMSQPTEPDNIVVDPSLGENVIVNYPQNEPNITIEKGIDPACIFAFVWLAGIAALLVYTAVSYIVLKRRVGRAVRLRDNIYQSENVVSPFVLGFIKPRIYLPFNIDGKDICHVIAHEKAHIRRKDNIWKPMGFILLAVHWFNPLMWLGYILLCRDIELACDEKVVKELDREARADYSEALLTCSVNRRMIAACPIAFGEVGVKGRVKSVLNYKKPAFWIILTAIVICLAVVICFLTDPIDMENIGIKSIAIEKADTNTFDLKLKYSFPSGSYSIENVQKDEGEYCGDGLVEYDGALGNYRILIKFGDTELSKELREKYPAGEVVELENAPIKTRIKCVYSQDHGVYIYVGFDELVDVNEIDNKKLNLFGGTVNIPIRIDTSLEPSFGITDPEGLTYEQRYLMGEYPEYFGLDAAKGLDVYVCQFAPKNYYFLLEEHGEPAQNFIDLSYSMKGLIGAASMRIILDTYDVEREDITVIPFQHILSSYIGPAMMVPADGSIEEAQAEYKEMILDMLLGEEQLTPPIYHSLQFDVDGDGKIEHCVLGFGMTEDRFSFTFSASEVTIGEWEEEYYKEIYSDWYKLSFVKDEDGVVRVQGVDENDEIHLFDISIVDGNIHLSENGISIERVENHANSLVFAEPSLSWVPGLSEIPVIAIENGILYQKKEKYIDGGICARIVYTKLGTAFEISEVPDDLKALAEKYGGYYSELVKDIIDNNDRIYRIDPEDKEGVSIYYVMYQKDGSTLIVYGHYEKGERTDFVRWIFKSKG